MASNPYTSVAIAGYNASPPSDDGAKVATNQLEWDKHKTKLGDPLKTLAEAINTNVVSAFGALVLTDDPAQETVLGAMTEFMDHAVMLAQRARRADRAVVANTVDPTENVVVMIQEFT